MPASREAHNETEILSEKLSAGMTLNEYADRVIFMGDMNYRVRGTRSAVDKLQHSMHDVD